MLYLSALEFELNDIWGRILWLLKEKILILRRENLSYDWVRNNDKKILIVIKAG